MKLYYGKVDYKSIQVKRRTFEGKNDNSLTSSYMPSYKYWYEFSTIDGIKHSNCTRTKQEALQAIENYRIKEGQAL